MLNFNDLKQVKEVVKEEIDPLKNKIDRIENNIDKVLQIVTTTQQELTIIASKLENHIHDTTKHHSHSSVPPHTPSIYA